MYADWKVSIHAPAGGATPVLYAVRIAALFQSTRPRGARPVMSFDVLTDGQVTIHAPAGGATTARGKKLTKTEFQSTRPRGARQNPTSKCCVLCCFNPRARGGRDWQQLESRLKKLVSIHAPAGGATEKLRN